jgi:phosphatidylcholine synthase
VRFLYPNLAPRPWKLSVMLGAAAWLALLLGMLLVYRRVPGWVVGVSLIYPAFYATLSILLDPKRRGRATTPRRGRSVTPTRTR